VAPGAGIAAEIGLHEAERGIQYAGQMAGLGVSAIQQTLFPDMPTNGPIMKALGGLMGGHPVTSDTADQGQQKQGGYQDGKGNDAGATPGNGQTTGRSAPPLQGSSGGDTTNNNQQSGDTIHGDVIQGDVNNYSGPQADPSATLGAQTQMAGMVP
jgi:hypothetical protein